ncbi:hypothetical protein FY528_08080 [Hymenobacter lutimineralis]|uniref:Uncharacterized protein n=1 Tax=Hymenobacter lutimineralis TaxID=2606448 RepID=A0A5D6V7V4_9BACT|nr:hypothetical protein [Hymenobacter lutimineralis]TYZ10998.1 hypothetical protein FY528_08080 [Hymenobacter lutimineralis]
MQEQPDNLTPTPDDAAFSQDGTPRTNHTPQYGEFGHATPTASPSGQRPAGANPGGVAAPSTPAPEQRGSVPQNLDSQEVRAVSDAEYTEQREGWAKDDPRYGSGTRNWETAEPANHSNGPAETNEDRLPNYNDGSNDNPDEFSALRDDHGKGIPGK